MYYIGIDGGGTKTICTLFDESGKELDSLLAPTSHFSQIGYEAMGELLHDSVNALCKRNEITPDRVVIGFGLAGYGREQQVRSSIEAAIASRFSSYQYLLANDVEIAMEGALAGQDGIVVVAGTGSIALSRFKGETSRCGGWGYRLGDEGSAYWIGRELLAAFTKQADGRIQKTTIYDLVMDHLCLTNDYDVISYINEHHARAEIAQLAILCYEAANLRDPIALQIYKGAAEELSQMIEVLGKKCKNESIIVSYLGGVFRSGDCIIEPMKQRLSNRFLIKPPTYTAVYGAYLMAKSMFEQK